MKKILLVFGTRPEAIKFAPLIKEFQKYSKEIDVVVCTTGQHRQMLDQVLELFDIRSDYDLNIMVPNQDLFDISSNVLLGVRDVLKKVRPDMVFVHGDTTTSMAAGLASFYEHIPVAHVEAGLRTYNLASPWPEEMNRQLVDRICDYCFAPTEVSRNNLLQEKIHGEIIVTGNTVIDALFLVVEMIKERADLKNEIIKDLEKYGYMPNERKYILVTGHRRENFGEGFLNICKSLKEIALINDDIDIVYPVHLNPNVQKPVYELLSDIKNVFLIKPLNYLPFVYLMQCCHFILTDSGGIQEEAPSLGKPVLVMRDTTERPEAVEAGTVKLVGTDMVNIVRNVQLLINDRTTYQKMAQAMNPYGDGKAASRIVALFREII